jgi:uncharacterized delta-60 repeat protein
VARLNEDGALDTSFADGLAGANGLVNAIAVQNDGKPLIGGSFQTVHGAPATYFARLNADGTLEGDFGQRPGGNAAVHALAVQSDSKVLVAGEFTVLNGATRNRIGRLNADGTLDSSFADGLAGADNIVRAVAAQTDGKVVIGGNFATVNGVSRSRIARLNADGTLDSAFGDGLSGADGEVRCLAVQSDGKVLIGGSFGMINGVSRNRIARLNADGSVDGDFGNGLSGANNSVFCLALQSDGKVLIGGNFTLINGVTRYRLVRLNADGTLDTNFVAALSGLSPRSLAIQGDGKILVPDPIGAAAPFYRIVRLNVDGSVDSSFGNYGAEGSVLCIAAQDDGKVLIAGGLRLVDGVNRNRIARLNADGTLDSSFAEGFSGPNGDVSVLAIHDDNKVLIGGSFWAVNGVPAAYFARLWGDRVPSTHPRIDSSPQTQRVTLGHSAAFSVLTAGTEPLSYQWLKDGMPIPGATNEAIVFQRVEFSDAGVYSIVVSNAEGTTSADAVLTVAWPEPGAADFSWTSAIVTNSSGAVLSTAIQPDGKILIGGSFTNIQGIVRERIARLNADGALDETFMSGLPGANGTVRSVVLQADGKVLIAGEFTNVNGVARGLIARLNVDGSVDHTFGNGLSGANGAVWSLAVQNDGKVLIGGFFATVNDVSRNRIARLNADGSLDTDFGTGVVQNSVLCIALQSDGRVLVGGTSRIIRLNPDGSLDNTFAGAGGSVLSVAVQNDGRMLIGGFFTSVNGVIRNRIARLNADGTLDATFGDALSGADSTVRSVAAQGDGKVLIVGQFGVVNGMGRTRIARLNADGTLDVSFGKGLSGANDTVQSIAVQSDSRVVIGGSFTMVNGVFSPYVARLWGDPRARIERLDGPQGGNVTLVLRLPEGTTNRVQYKTNLDDSAWIDLPGDMIGDNRLTNKLDATLNGVPHRFYRVRQVP